MEDNTIHLYCDGGTRGNQFDDNIGAYGAILHYKGHKRYLSMGFRNTTNNIMELKSVIEGLKAMKKYDIPIKVYSDSAYVVNGINKGWVKGWKSNGWLKSDGKPVKNMELWDELDYLISLFNEIDLVKVKGHANNEGNNEVDALVNKEMDNME